LDALASFEDECSFSRGGGDDGGAGGDSCLETVVSADCGCLLVSLFWPFHPLRLDFSQLLLFVLSSLQRSRMAGFCGLGDRKYDRAGARARSFSRARK
jgi:hypothetical protein